MVILDCVDFRNLNKSSKKDNYLVPPMEQILQKVSGSEILSLLDGFSGYNQILVSTDDQLKKTFRAPWATYAYRKMPFGLINAGATFQRAMDIDFRWLFNHLVVVYLDDATIFYKCRHDLINHLRKLFERCRKFRVSLNPKKTIFDVPDEHETRHLLCCEHLDPVLDRSKKCSLDWCKAYCEVPEWYN